MNKTTKLCLCIGAGLILLGGLIFVGTMSALKWDFMKLSSQSFQDTTHQITQEYQNISVTTDTGDVVFYPAQDGKTTVICHEEPSMPYAVSVQNGTLEIRLVDNKPWYEEIGFNFGSSKISVYLPAGQYAALSISGDTCDVSLPKDFLFESILIQLSTGDTSCSASATGDIDISASTGDIHLNGSSAANLKLQASTGNINATGVNCTGDVTLRVTTGHTTLTDMTCQALTSSGSTGQITLANVIATGAFNIQRSTGDVTFHKCDASALTIYTDTGDVTGSLLTPKIFHTDTDTGDVTVPISTEGGLCEITTDTGDITITIG